MTEPLQLGQFAIVDHEPVERGPNAGYFHGKGPSDDRAEFSILAEGTTPAGESFAGHVVSALGQLWQSLDISLTGSLHRAFAEANNSLIEWNRKSIAQHRVSLGLTCLGRRGDQAVIAQAGPSVVFHRSGNTCDIIYTDEEHGRPLGMVAGCTPQLTRIIIAPGDRVLLVSSAAIKEMDEDLIGNILGLETGQVLGNLYQRLQHLKHVTVLLLAAPEERASMHAPATELDEPIIGASEPSLLTIGEEPTEPGDDGPFQPTLFIRESEEDALDTARRQLEAATARERRHAAAIPSVVIAMPAPLQRAAGDIVLARRLARDRQARATVAGVMRPVLANGHAHGARRPAAQASSAEVTSIDDRRRQRRRDSWSRGLVRDEAPPLPPPASDHAPLAGDIVASLRSEPAPFNPAMEAMASENALILSGAGSLVRVRGGMSGRWHGDGSLSRGSTALSFGKLPPTWWIIAGGLGFLLLIVGALTIPRLLDGSDGDRALQLFDTAQQRLSAARALTDATEKRDALTESQALLLEARDLGGAPGAEGLLEDVRADLKTLDAIVEPASVEVVSSLAQFGEKPVVAARIALGAERAFVLDSASGQVIAIALDGSDRPVVYAEDAAAGRGRPTAIAFLDGDDLGSPSLVIADHQQKLWAYSASDGLRPIPLRGSGADSITDIAVSGRDVFILDARAATVYRYSVSAGALTAPVKERSGPLIAAAARLTVLAGSEVLTTGADGSIHWFTGNTTLTLSQAGIDRRLTTAQAPQALSKGEIAVVDPPNNRVVVLQPNGPFVRQYQHKAFEAMAAFVAIDGGAGGYIFSDGKLLRVTW